MKSPERDYLGKALDIAVRLAAIGVIVVGSFRIFSPFLLAVIWAIVLAVTFHPLYVRMNRRLGERPKLSATVFIVLSLAIVIVPTGLLMDSLLDATVRVVRQVEAGTLEIPPPTEEVRNWPVIGERVYAIWQGASVDLQGTAAKLQPQLRNVGKSIISNVSGLGKALVQTIAAIIIAGILMATYRGPARTARSVAMRLGGGDGPPMVDLAVGTIRSVVKGVVLVALIQGLLAAVGFAIAGVPGVGLWTLIVIMLAVMQVPTILILAPIVVWVFANSESTAVQIFITIWSLGVSVSDNLLKPVFLGRGVKVPMLVVLIGAIGGMLRSGLVGLFIGPVVLTIFYELCVAWLRDDDTETTARPEPDTVS